MENKINFIKEELTNYLEEGFDIELTDSPQILEEDLYLQYWGLDCDVKLRIPYAVDRKHFLNMHTFDRHQWIIFQILRRIIKTSTQSYEFRQ